MIPGRLVWMLVIAVVFPAVGSAEPITGLVVFGDSLSDVGNVSAATNGAYPPGPYSMGRFSNGPVWVEQLANKLGLPDPVPSLKGGLDYAYGFAQTGTGSGTTSVSGLTVPNMGTQVSSYLAGHTPGSGQLFVLWGGANDFFHGQTDPSVPAANIASEINTLAHAGASHFLVLNLPLLGNTPFGATLPSAQQQGLNALSAGFNGYLSKDLDQLRAQLAGVTIHSADVASLLQQIQANPGAFGFSNATDAALLTGHANDPGYLFWDSVHPTAQGDTLIAATAAESLPEPAALTLAGLGALAVAGYCRRRRALAV